MKKNYIIPQSRIVELGMQELIASSDDPQAQSINYGGDDGGSGTAEIKTNSIWDNGEW